MNAEPLIFISAGEASGDVHAANLMKAVKKLRPGARFAGMGGPLMRAEGLQCLIRAEDMAVVGLVEVLGRLPFYHRTLRFLARSMKELGASVFVAVDFPDFNLRLCREAGGLDIPVVYYICPQVWAWRKGRVRDIEALVDVLLTILPFEARYFSREKLSTVYVGHPLLDEVPPTSEERDPQQGKGVIAVMPGSRRSELANHMPALVPFMVSFLQKHPGVSFRIPCAQTLRIQDLLTFFDHLPPSVQWQSRIEICSPGSSTEVLRSADAALIASGTSTLQGMLCNVPFAIFYRLSPLTYWIGRCLISVKHVGLVNIIAEKELCREFVQGSMNPEKLGRECERLLWDRSYRQVMLQEFARMRREFGAPGASLRAAEAVLHQTIHTR